MSALLWATTASAVDRWVTSTSDTNSGTGASGGTLRYQLGQAGPGDHIRFSTTTFPAGATTPILVGSGGSALPTLVDDGVLVDGEGRVALEAVSTLTSGNGLTIDADDVAVWGLEIRGFPGHGIQVTGHGGFVGNPSLAFDPNRIHDNDQLGILVTGLSTTTADVTVWGNELWHNCLNTTVSCAGIGIKKGTAPGAGPTNILVTVNQVDDTRSGGHGVGVFAGSDHHINSNELGLAAGNTGSGIAVVAPSGGSAQVDEIDGNLVVNNTQSGILLGLNSANCGVGSNLVGTDGTADLGNGGAGIAVFASDYHWIHDNVVSGNTLQGIAINGTTPGGSPSEGVTVEDNLVGLSSDGYQPLGNGQVGIDLAGANQLATNHMVRRNFVAANGSHGIKVAARAVTLEGNVVGLDFAQNSEGNGLDGLWVTATGALAHVGPWNVFSANARYGVQVSGNDVVIDRAVIGTTLKDGNRPGEVIGLVFPLPGQQPEWPVDRGNGDVGLRVSNGQRGRVSSSTIARSGGDGLSMDVGATAVADWVLESNELTHNDGSGLSVSGSVTDTAWLANRIHDNGGCAYDVSPTVNGAPLAATVDVQGPHRVAGWHAGTRVDVYVDADGEAGRWLGQATLNGVDWELVLGDTDPPIPAGARVTAIATNVDRSAVAGGWCGEVCANAAVSTRCFDGNSCTSDTCAAGDCTYPANLAANGNVCDDGDDCTTASTCQAGACVGTAFALADTACVDDSACSETSTCNANHECTGVDDHVCDDGDPCTQEVDDDDCDPVEGCPTTPRPIGYRCEDGDLCTPSGTCDASGACVLPPTYPAVTCPQDTQCNTCECLPGQGCVCEGVCGDGKCGPDDFTANGGQPCPECFLPGQEFDTDHDGIPNIWDGDDKNIDIDCDGTFEYGPLGLEQNPTIEGVRDVLLEIDWMAPEGGHEHYPYQTEYLVDRFSLHGMALHVDVSDQVPHVDLTVPSPKRTPLEASSASTWSAFRDLKRQWFDARDRRGLYHYHLMVHDIESGGSRSFLGLGENRGDDSMNAKETEDQIAGFLETILHEIGHNFGLDHGGSANGNHEVNYISSMNYGYGLLQTDLEPETTGYSVDYSWNELEVMDEAAGIEEFCAMWCSSTPTEGPLYLAHWSCPPELADPGEEPPVKYGPPHRPGTSLGILDVMVDLDCDGVEEPGEFVDHPLMPQNPTGFHHGRDDWEDLRFDHFTDASFTNELFNKDGPHGEATREDLAGAQVLHPTRFPRAVVYPGGTLRRIPRAGAAHRVPLVVYGAPDFDPTDLPNRRFHGAPVWTRTEADVDSDGHVDLWLEYRAVDITALNTNALGVVWSSVLPTSQRVTVQSDVTRVQNPADADGDGLHDVVDACDDTPAGSARGPEGCPWP